MAEPPDPHLRCKNRDQCQHNCYPRLRVEAPEEGFTVPLTILPHHRAHKTNYCILLGWGEEHEIRFMSVGASPPIMWFQTTADALAFKLRWL